jgi:transcriptional regulator with XRE-family HTH domain
VTDTRSGSLTSEDREDHEATLRSFAERLRAVREMASLSQDELDARCCLHSGMVSKFECGRKTPGLFVLLRLADGLRVDPGLLLDALPVPRRTESTQRALSLIEVTPGIKSNTIADAMGVTSSYVFRLIRWLAAEGWITEYEGGWKVAVGDTPEASATVSLRAV